MKHPAGFGLSRYDMPETGAPQSTGLLLTSLAMRLLVACGRACSRSAYIKKFAL